MSVQTPELSVIRMLIEQTPSTESRSHFHKAFAITILEFTALLIYSLAVETDHKYCSRESSVIMSQCEASYDVTEGYDEFYCAGGCYSHNLKDIYHNSSSNEFYYQCDSYSTAGCVCNTWKANFIPILVIDFIAVFYQSVLILLFEETDSEDVQLRMIANYNCSGPKLKQLYQPVNTFWSFLEFVAFMTFFFTPSSWAAVCDGTGGVIGPTAIYTLLAVQFSKLNIFKLIDEVTLMYKQKTLSIQGVLLAMINSLCRVDIFLVGFLLIWTQAIAFMVVFNIAILAWMFSCGRLNWFGSIVRSSKNSSSEVRTHPEN